MLQRRSCVFGSVCGNGTSSVDGTPTSLGIGPDPVVRPLLVADCPGIDKRASFLAVALCTLHSRLGRPLSGGLRSSSSPLSDFYNLADSLPPQQLDGVERVQVHWCISTRWHPVIFIVWN